MPASSSDFSIEAVPTSTGWKRSLARWISPSTARYFSSAVR
jgi:hypothetical protein